MEDTVLRPMILVAASLLGLQSAAPSAQALPYTGTLTVSAGSLDPIGTQAGGDGVSNPGAVAIGPGATFTTTLTVPLTEMTPNGATIFPASPLVDQRLTGPAGFTAASFAAGGGPDGGFGGDAALAGSYKIGLFGPPPFAFLTVPLDAVGVEGSSVRLETPLDVVITVFGGGWTTGAVQVIGTTGPFAGELLAQATGADQRTAGGAGSIVLVTPTLTRTNVAGSENLALIGTLTLEFVPEPGTLLLVGSGLALLGLRRRRRYPAVSAATRFAQG